MVYLYVRMVFDEPKLFQLHNRQLPMLQFYHHCPHRPICSIQHFHVFSPS